MMFYEEPFGRLSTQGTMQRPLTELKKEFKMDTITDKNKNRVKIYLLEDPRLTNLRCYVGQTVDLKKRLQTHMSNPYNTNGLKSSWIDELKFLGLQPTMTLLEETDRPHADERELFWMASYGSSDRNIMMNSDQDMWTAFMRYSKTNLSPVTNNAETGLKKQVVSELSVSPKGSDDFHFRPNQYYDRYYPELSFVCPEIFVTDVPETNHYVRACIEWFNTFYKDDSLDEDGLENHSEKYLTHFVDHLFKFDPLLNDISFKECYTLLGNHHLLLSDDVYISGDDIAIYDYNPVSDLLNKFFSYEGVESITYQQEKRIFMKLLNILPRFSTLSQDIIRKALLKELSDRFINDDFRLSLIDA
jgi:hypothetical protein